MVWMEKTAVSERQEFVQLAGQDGANVRALCRRFGISPKTGYKWLARAAAASPEQALSALSDRSRRPHQSPGLTDPALQQLVLDLRREHPAWGGRKIARRLLDLGHPALAPSTVTHILHRRGLISAQASQDATAWQRFEHAQPNSLWQIDFKGHFSTLQGPCHALTLLDDHSRFNLTLQAHASTSGLPVQRALTEVFTRYGLPARLNADNGGPWGSPRSAGQSLSYLAIWLIRLGIRLSYSAPYHPQTNGKIERFHRSLQAEALQGQHFSDLAQVQRRFDAWRAVYNCQRPHEALMLAVPASRYQPSPIAMPAQLPAVQYPAGDTVLVVGWHGFITHAGRRIRTSTGLKGLPVALRPHPDIDGLLDIYFCHQKFMTEDLRQPQTAN